MALTNYCKSLLRPCGESKLEKNKGFKQKITNLHVHVNKHCLDVVEYFTHPSLFSTESFLFNTAAAAWWCNKYMRLKER